MRERIGLHLDSYAYSIDSELTDVCRQYGASVLRRCHQILGNETEAEDAAQDIFLTILKKGGSFRGDSAVSTWIYRVTTNHCLNVIRSRKRRKSREESDGVENWMDKPTAHPAALLEARRQYDCVMEELDAFSQQLFIYRFVDGLSQTELESITGKSRRTIGKKLKKITQVVESHSQRSAE
jgi:RNA polymerase sigma-70 factor, ECF subfamily